MKEQNWGSWRMTVLKENYFPSSKSLQKIENIQKRALRFLLDDNDSTYEELLVKSNNNFMSVKRLKVLCTEIYKTLKNLNPKYEWYFSIFRK